jgi:hypothetical protein
MATIVNSTESNGFLVVHSHEAGQRVVRVAEFLSTLEEAYNALILLDRFLDEMPQPTATVRPFESDTARIRGARSRIEWHPSARSYAGLVSTRDSLRRAAQIIQPNARLRLYAVEVHSPGFWAFAGKLIPFDCIRQWIQDAHERRKDRAYREADEEERLDLENEMRKANIDARQLDNELKRVEIFRKKVEVARELGATDTDLNPLLQNLFHKPLKRLERYPDIVEEIEVRTDDESGDSPKLKS